MMAQPAKPEERSMEEAVASIHRVIANDDFNGAARPPAAAPAPAMSPPHSQPRGRAPGSGTTFQILAAVILLQLAIFAGAGMALGWQISSAWNMVFAAMGMAALGFGAATLLYRRFAAREVAELAADYQLLTARSRSLVEKLDRMETKQHSLADNQLASRG
jgi:hypothetical protein